MNKRFFVAFGVVSALLLVAAVGLNAGVSRLELTFAKQAVPLQKPIEAVPAEMGPWHQVTLDRRFPEEIEHELGTKDYIHRTYIDSRKLSQTELESFEGAGDTERMAMVGMIAHRDPTAAIDIGLTFYTGAVDTVPHIPERCMVAGGFTPTNPEVRFWPVSNSAGDSLSAQFIRFDFQRNADGTDTRTYHVAYFFQVNGQYEHDAITGVRKRLQNLFEPHAYFAKIELKSYAADADLADEVMQDFLTHAIPELERVLPDWTAFKAAQSSEG
ncbi:MAG: exosortase-associated EpsI family protein [Phycisphaerae bacterium]